MNEHVPFYKRHVTFYGKHVPIINRDVFFKPGKPFLILATPSFCYRCSGSLRKKANFWKTGPRLPFIRVHPHNIRLVDIGSAVAVAQLRGDQQLKRSLPLHLSRKVAGLHLNGAEDDILIARAQAAANAGVKDALREALAIIAHQGPIEVEKRREAKAIRLVARKENRLRLRRNALKALRAVRAKLPQPKRVIQAQRLIHNGVEDARIGSAVVLANLKVSAREVELRKSAQADHQRGVIQFVHILHSAHPQVVLAEVAVGVGGVIIKRDAGVRALQVVLLPPAAHDGYVVAVRHVLRNAEAIHILRLDKLLPEEGQLAQHRLLVVVDRIKAGLEVGGIVGELLLVIAQRQKLPVADGRVVLHDVPQRQVVARPGIVDIVAVRHPGAIREVEGINRRIRAHINRPRPIEVGRRQGTRKSESAGDLRLIADRGPDVNIIVPDIEVDKRAADIILVVFHAIAKAGVARLRSQKGALYALAHPQKIAFRNPRLHGVGAVIIQHHFYREDVFSNDQQVHRIVAFRYRAQEDTRIRQVIHRTQVALVVGQNVRINDSAFLLEKIIANNELLGVGVHYTRQVRRKVFDARRSIREVALKAEVGNDNMANDFTRERLKWVFSFCIQHLIFRVHATGVFRYALDRVPGLLKDVVHPPLPRSIRRASRRIPCMPRRDLRL